MEKKDSPISTMILDSKVSFETAKLAKEKGFPQELFNTAWYNELGDLYGRTDLNKDGKTFNEVHNSSLLFIPQEYKNEFKLESFLAPERHQLQKWLRDIHNLHIEIRLGHDFDEIWYDYSIKKIEYSLDHDELASSPSGIDTYEEALEAGLAEALKLI